MADMSERTRLEMAAGAQALAAKNDAVLPPDYMEAIIRTHQRNAQLRQWERNGKVRIEDSKRFRSGSVRYQRSDDDPLRKEPWERMYHVLPEKGGPTFTDLPAERDGTSPSEVLIANIALALQAMGEL